MEGEDTAGIRRPHMLIGPASATKPEVRERKLSLGKDLSGEESNPS